jgi:hypothetical protein
MLSIPLTIKIGGVWVTVKFIPLTVLTIEITSKLVRLYRSEVKNGDVVVIYSPLNASGNRGRFGKTARDSLLQEIV